MSGARPLKLFCIDLNCDLGEIPGDEGRLLDRQLLHLVSSANIACGAHAGDESTMRHTVVACKDLRVAIGAHPGYRDREHFGRRPLSIPPTQIEDLVRQQIESLQAIALSENARVVHVKPHGALYNQAAVSSEIADAICRAIAAVDPTLFLFGLSGSRLQSVGDAHGLKTVSEVFCDRNYLPDGTLVPRDHPHSLITDPAIGATRIVQMIRTGQVAAIDGSLISVVPQTISLHSDHAAAAHFAKTLRQHLDENLIAIANEWVSPR